MISVTHSCNSVVNAVDGMYQQVALVQTHKGLSDMVPSM